MSCLAKLKFQEFLQNVDRNLAIEKLLEASKQNKRLQKYKLHQLSFENAYEMYFKILKKHYSIDQELIRNLWYENQLRLLVWISIIYCFSHQKTFKNLDLEDFEKLGKFFGQRDSSIIEFQLRHFYDNTGNNTEWKPQQEHLLIKIFQEKSLVGKTSQICWNNIAKDLFVFSKKAYFRTSKQCRERWLNHLDPKKDKTQHWSYQEDLILISYVKFHGKHWSQISKIMGCRRNDHTIKNRFRMVMNKKLSRSRLDINQKLVLTRLMSQLRSKCDTYHQILDFIKSYKKGEELAIEKKLKLQESYEQIDDIKCQLEPNQENELKQGLIVKDQCIEKMQTTVKIQQADSKHPQVKKIESNSYKRIINSLK